MTSAVMVRIVPKFTLKEQVLMMEEDNWQDPIVKTRRDRLMMGSYGSRLLDLCCQETYHMIKGSLS